MAASSTTATWCWSWPRRAPSAPALLGYPSHAAYMLEDQTAKTTGAVNKLLAEFAKPAVNNAKKEAADLQKVIDAEGANSGTPFQAAAYDWNYYSDKVRAQRYAFDQNQLRPYFEYNRVLIDGVFFAATKEYGITFKERKDLPVYDPDVRVFDVFDTDGKQLAIFLHDPYARANKRGGAWMNAYVGQNTLLGTHPVIANHLNIPKPAAGEPTLLTYDEARTMFHEFGHALHGMFSNVKYPRFSGTRVPRDYVEFPSQVNEMWMAWPEVLANYAKHYQTGAPMPKELLDKVQASAKFNEGYRTTEYLAASMLDQSWHQLGPDQIPADVLGFEAKALHDAGVDFPLVPPRYRTTYFSHVFSGGYSAGYYGYLWAEKLDADTVEWFKENGGLTAQERRPLPPDAAVARRHHGCDGHVPQLPRARCEDRAAAGAPWLDWRMNVPAKAGTHAEAPKLTSTQPSEPTNFGLSKVPAARERRGSRAHPSPSDINFPTTSPQWHHLCNECSGITRYYLRIDADPPGRALRLGRARPAHRDQLFHQGPQHQVEPEVPAQDALGPRTGREAVSGDQVHHMRDDMLNDNEDTLKAHLKTLHRHLEETGEVDDELEMLLRQLDGDIKHVLERRADDPDANTYGLASRSQEITARFAARHPTLEPALRQLGNILEQYGHLMDEVVEN
jgi:hypothetical protein